MPTLALLERNRAGLQPAPAAAAGNCTTRPETPAVTPTPLPGQVPADTVAVTLTLVKAVSVASTPSTVPEVRVDGSMASGTQSVICVGAVPVTWIRQRRSVRE